jgi:CheY-like chemotaxis protein/signal transduction histidine kinase/HAMP domain-containing protein
MRTGNVSDASNPVHLEKPERGKRAFMRGNGNKVKRAKRGARAASDICTPADLVVALRALEAGDFEVQLPEGGEPVMVEIAETFNRLAQQNGRARAELARIGRTVGREGKMTDRARVDGLEGGWRAMIDSVNALIADLVQPTTEIARVLTAVAEGNLSQKMVLEIEGKSVQGEFLRIGTTVNRMVDQLGSFASEVTRVAREVGTEGKLGGQAQVPGVAGTWKDLTDNVNSMARRLTDQVRNIALVTTAVANGDLTQKITAEAQGEILELKNTINVMVGRLSVFASEVTRVAREVGTEGVLGGQAQVPNVAGTWKDLTDSVNFMAGNLTAQVRNIADVTTAVARGDLTQKITVDVRGEVLELKKTINTMVDQLGSFASEVTRVAREVGTEGRLGGQANVSGVAGTWKDLTDSVNFMASNLTGQVRNIANVTTAVARGDLTRKITVAVKGEILELKNTINVMVDQLSAFASEVTRVAREVGTEGVLGGQANVPGVAGTWKDLTDNVNAMAGNLTSQVRNIALVTTAVANGDLSQKITVDVRGEILDLKNTVNAMVDSLRLFADEVTRVAKEVGTEGELGGQAEVPSATGVWRGLVDNVNQLANNLTVQVRAIADVAAAVTKGDLTRTITVDARGEVDELKTSLNQMISNLKATTERNQEQDWLKTNLAKFSRMMQGQKDLETVSRLMMSELTPLVSAHFGAFFIMDNEGNGSSALRLIASYAYKERKHLSNQFQLGEGLVGQAALEKTPILLTNVPDNYVRITSGLGDAPPRNIIVLPILFEGQVKAVIELASFLPFSQIHQLFLDQLGESVGVVLNMIAANMRTEELLQQSQALTGELQAQSEELKRQQGELRRSNAELETQARTLKASEELLKEQQEELQQVNEELEEKAALLAEQNRKVEQKNTEVEQARQALEEKAAQLSLSSKYKSEFLANMSHELRTPLNSLLILAKQLSNNADRNLTAKQVEFAETILSSGSDLLSLINDILDLSKVEAGRMEVHSTTFPIGELIEFCDRSFRPIAQEKNLGYELVVAADTPVEMHTDRLRLEQVLKNLLSNAFKFTEAGGVSLRVEKANRRRFANPILDNAEFVLAFAVMDSGIGIPRDKQRLIFEAFQQADGTTSRKYGGTGLGLSISREITRLLGGEIQVESQPGRGSTFTLYLPLSYEPSSEPAHEDEYYTVRRDAGSRMAERRAVRAASRLTGATRTVATAALEQEAQPNLMDDDRDSIEPGDRVLLVIENDRRFARILLDLARDKHFRTLVALEGESGLRMAHDFKPDAITLDIDLPGIDGWTVLERLKHHPATRHIPVHIVSGMDSSHEGLRLGAISYLEKPVSKEALEAALDRIASFIDKSVKSLLVVEDDETQRRSIIELIGEDDVEITAVGTAEAALEQLGRQQFDCMVLDLGLKDTSGFTLLETIKSDPSKQTLPVIIYTGKELTQNEETRLKRYAETIIIKDVRSPERLLDETALFLHRVEAQLPEQKRRMLEQLHSSDAVFAGRHVLIVDDDVRNIYALTSLLEGHGMQVSFAENGVAALEMLQNVPPIDLALMDVMMPELDGYATTRAIRDLPEYRTLPILALTAKAMKGDREECIEAGASDYITKPVDSDQLLSLMRVWLYR